MRSNGRVACLLAGAVGVVLLVPGAASASLPKRNTTYAALVERGDDGRVATIRIKIGTDRTKVAKVVVIAECEGGDAFRIVRRNLPIDKVGGFTASKLTDGGDVLYAINGAWESKRSLYGEVDLSLDRCPPGGFGFSVTV